MAPLDQICEGLGGLFLTNDWGGLKSDQSSRNYLVGFAYVTNEIHLDSSGNSPKRHSIGTTVSCVGGTEDMTLFQRFMDFYSHKEMPPAWTTSKPLLIS